MNKIEAVADILGLKIYEEFDVDKVPYGPEWNNSRVVGSDLHMTVWKNTVQIIKNG